MTAPDNRDRPGSGDGKGDEPRDVTASLAWGSGENIIPRRMKQQSPLPEACLTDEQCAEERAKLLQVDHLTMRFGGLTAVSDVSFVVRRGEITALIGPNGAGKTTVFNCITGFYKPTSGRLAFGFGELIGIPSHMIEAATRADGRSLLDLKSGRRGYLLERMPGHEITAKARVARTFQNIRLFTFFLFMFLLVLIVLYVYKARLIEAVAE